MEKNELESKVEQQEREIKALRIAVFTLMIAFIASMFYLGVISSLKSYLVFFMVFPLIGYFGQKLLWH